MLDCTIMLLRSGISIEYKDVSANAGISITRIIETHIIALY